MMSRSRYNFYVLKLAFCCNVNFFHFHNRGTSRLYLWGIMKVQYTYVGQRQRFTIDIIFVRSDSTDVYAALITSLLTYPLDLKSLPSSACQSITWHNIPTAHISCKLSLHIYCYNWKWQISILKVVNFSFKNC